MTEPTDPTHETPPHFLPAVLPSYLPALPAEHAQALARVQARYEAHLAVVQAGVTQAEQDLDDAVATTQAVTEEAAREHARDVARKTDMLTNPPDRRHGPDDEALARCVCDRPLTGPGFCSQACAEQATTTEARKHGDTLLEGGWVLIADQSEQAALLARERAQERALRRAQDRAATVADQVALVRSGKSRSELRDEVAARQRIMKAAQDTRSALRAAARRQAAAVYRLDRLAWDAQQEIITRFLDATAYLAADEAAKAAERAYDAAAELWNDLLRAECAVRAVPLPPQMCVYCGGIEVRRDGDDPTRMTCSDGCQRALTRDGMTEPFPGCHLCEVCWRWFRNPSNPDCPYCSTRCLRSQPVDVEPWLRTTDFAQSYYLKDVPKSPAERRRYARLLAETIARETEPGAATARPIGPEVLPPSPAPRTLALPSPTETAREAILARLRAHPAGLATEALLAGLGLRSSAARKLLRALVAEGLVVADRGGKTGTARLYRLAPPSP